MKPFFWKRVLIAPEMPAGIIWKKLKDEKVD